MVCLGSAPRTVAIGMAVGGVTAACASGLLFVAFQVVRAFDGRAFLTGRLVAEVGALLLSRAGMYGAAAGLALTAIYLWRDPYGGELVPVIFATLPIGIAATVLYFEPAFDLRVLLILTVVIASAASAFRSSHDRRWRRTGREVVVPYLTGVLVGGLAGGLVGVIIGTTTWFALVGVIPREDIAVLDPLAQLWFFAGATAGVVVGYRSMGDPIGAWSLGRIVRVGLGFGAIVSLGVVIGTVHPVAGEYVAVVAAAVATSGSEAPRGG